jgi:hypothetical protein
LPSFWWPADRLRATTRRVSGRLALTSVILFASALLAACGGKTSADAQCEAPCAAGGAGGSAGAPPMPVPVDASIPECAKSCGALAALDCPAGYDPAPCVVECESAMVDAECGSLFDDSIDCLLEHGEPGCTFTGAAQFFDPELYCAAELDVYATCAAQD